ncbi:MAG: RodZ domain-containing protein [Litorimonas sp.]
MDALTINQGVKHKNNINMTSNNSHHTLKHIGVRLKDKRQALELSIDDVANMTHLRADYLRNIETLNVEDLPSIGYVLGFVRTYAKTLGMDGANAVTDYKLDVQVPENLGMRDEPHFVPQFKLRLPRGFVPALMTLGFAVMLGAWYGVQTETQAAEQVVVEYDSEDIESTASSLTQDDLVTLRANAPSWVQIKDESGTILISRIFVAGETWQGPKDNKYSISVRDAGAIKVFYGDIDQGVLGSRGEAKNNIEITYKLSH